MTAVSDDNDHLVRFKESHERNEKDYLKFKNDYEIVKRAQETIQEEMKRTKEKCIKVENDNKDKDRNIKDLSDKLKDYEIKITLQESQINDMETRLARAQSMADNHSHQDFGVEIIVPKGSSAEDKAKLEENAKQIETIMASMNTMKETMDNQKASHLEQTKKLTDRVEDFRRENTQVKKENDQLRSRIEELERNAKDVVPQQPKREVAAFPKDDSSIMGEILQKSLELENNVRKFKVKSDELANQLIRDREFYNLNLSVLYSLLAETSLTEGKY